jgi:(E)-4-hydroxy-3-methylbut-2-enyl-diphosphate synthase
MTNTDTMDTKATVAQVIRMIEAGSEYVRLTAQGVKEAENLAVIKKELHKKGFRNPLIADIHFNPKAAEVAACLVEKVRINPGNYVDKKVSAQLDYTDLEYAGELERIAERLHPLLTICKEYGTVIRIGTNHGSLSDRIMSRYGDTPEGMVESALEFLKICHDFGHRELVLSMKSSNIKVTAYANRLLAARMDALGMNYPIHLGVTEAGNEEDGRIKSAIGIGSLLEDGIGDTIRVSLTEDPENELLPARDIVRKYNKRKPSVYFPSTEDSTIPYFSYFKRASKAVGNIGGGQKPIVITSCNGIAGFQCYYFSRPLSTPEYIHNSPHVKSLDHPYFIDEIHIASKWNPDDPTSLPLYSASEYLQASERSSKMNFVSVGIEECKDEFVTKVSQDPTVVLVFDDKGLEDHVDLLHHTRRLFQLLAKHGCNQPVVLKRKYTDLHPDLMLINASVDFGSLLVDGLGDGLWLEGDPEGICKFPTRTAFSILQATGDRITRTDYIACPSCGRTQFDIQKALQDVKDKTSHLAGLKIAVMGCIVNGPGEMADADYGYVGAGGGKVNLYKGKELVKRNIEEEIAVEELIGLIRDNGDWE